MKRSVNLIGSFEGKRFSGPFAIYAESVVRQERFELPLALCLIECRARPTLKAKPPAHKHRTKKHRKAVSNSHEESDLLRFYLRGCRILRRGVCGQNQFVLRATVDVNAGRLYSVSARYPRRNNDD